MKEKKFVSVVIYLHNMEKQLDLFLDQVLPIVNDNFEKMEIIFVDDACEDGTMELLHSYIERNSIDAMVNVIHMSFYHGLESSMNAGRNLAIGDFVFEFDDMIIDYSLDVIMDIYRKMVEGYDIVAASSDCKKPITSRLFYDCFNKTSRCPGAIGQETFRIISRRAINRIKTSSPYIPYRKAAYVNSGLKTAVLSYQSKDKRCRIRNKKNVRDRMSLALDSFIYFTNAMERLSAIISVIFLTITVGMGIYILADVLDATRPTEGWPSMMGFIAVGFFGIFALLTIILKYLSVMLNLIFKKQQYMVEDIEKIVK